MRLYHINEAEGSLYHVRSALGVDSERWNDVCREINRWRLELEEHFDIPSNRELYAGDLLTGRGITAESGDDKRLTGEQARDVFLGGLRVIENVASTVGGVEVINVCLNKQDVRAFRQVSLNRLLNRINNSVGAAGRHAFLIFHRDGKSMISKTYRRLRIFNPVPSRYRMWEEGERTRNIPVEGIIGGPAFRSLNGDPLLQIAGFVAHALLAQEDDSYPVNQDPVIRRAFSILDPALNRRASRLDPQGIVRR